MIDQEIVNRVKKILVEEFEIEKDIITPDSTLYEELELDSLDSVDLVVALENEFEFKIDRTKDEATLRKMRTLSDVVDFINSKLS